MQESNSDEDEMRRQWEADKPLSERLKVNSLLLTIIQYHCVIIVYSIAAVYPKLLLLLLSL